MSIAALGGMGIIPVGNANRQGGSSLNTTSNVTVDAANEAAIYIGYLWWSDGGSHTVDTSGSSSLQWRSGSVTFANAGTTVKVGLAAVDTAAGPPARAANAANVITFDVSRSMTGGGGGVTGNAWQSHVPDSGTKTIAHGDLIAFAVQMTARGGTDTVQVSQMSAVHATPIPCVTAFIAAAYANQTRLPNCVIVASDGTEGYLYGGYIYTTQSSQTWNNTSATKEYGNILRFPFPVRAQGIIASNSIAGNCDLVLYSDPLGTPVAERTVSVDLNTVGQAISESDLRSLFSSPYDLAANTDYAVIAKPTSATNVSMSYKTFNASSHQASELLGTNCYAINRNTGAFAAQNSNKDRFAIGLLVGGFDDGAGGGSIAISTVSADIVDWRAMLPY